MKCEDCLKYSNEVREVDICRFKYNLCRDCENDRDFNDEMDGVYNGEYIY